MNNKILFVDDDTNLLDAIHRSLRKQFSISTAVGGAEGLRKITQEGPFSVIVADMQMPEMSGLEFLRRVQTEAPAAVRMMLTGNSDLQTAMNAVNDGRVFRFLTKPCPPTVMAPALEAGLEQFRLERVERELLENTLGGAVKVLTEILAFTDPETSHRSQLLKEYVRGFTPVAPPVVSWELELAAMLSQLGRVTVPPSLLGKLHDGLSLSGAEKDIVARIPEFGAHLIENIPRLDKVANIVRYQDKRFDGSGFPTDHVSGDEIPIGARILKVLSDLIDFEKRGVDRGTAFQRMQERVGWYDPKVLTAVSHWCDVALRGPSESPILQIRIDEMRVGQTIAEDLRTKEGVLIVPVNTKISSMLLVKLLNFRTLQTIDQTVCVFSESENAS